MSGEMNREPYLRWHPVTADPTGASRGGSGFESLNARTMEIIYQEALFSNAMRDVYAGPSPEKQAWDSMTPEFRERFTRKREETGIKVVRHVGQYDY